MTKKEFLNKYWKHYLLLEQDFLETKNFVELSVDNYKTYSIKYMKIILSVCGEIDCVLKEYCKIFDAGYNKNCIKDYREDIIGFEKSDASVESLGDQTIKVYNGIDLKPWQNWYVGSDSTPVWWKAYNKIKHDRTGINNIGGAMIESFKAANLEYALNALAALYQVLLNFYRKIVNPSDQVKIPLNCSELFTLSSSYWDSVEFHYVYIIGIDSSGYLNITNQFDSVK